MENILFLVGESGCGKTTLQKKLIDAYPGFCKITSTTTRAPREGEVEGWDYHFVDEEKFESMVQADRFLQHAEFGARYGTTMDEYERDATGIFVCTPTGVMDTINALKERGIEMDYTVLFFASTDKLLESHGIDAERLGRGDIRGDFMKRYFSNEFDTKKVMFANDDTIHSPFFASEVLKFIEMQND